jgi:hypothetical protein
MLKKILFCLLVIPLLLTSCKNDLDIIGEWKEVAIVYGLLDPGEEVNYVRVQKAFLGEGNAMIMAQQHDSIYYGEEVTVVLERRRNGQLLSTIIMERDTTTDKDPGTFTTQGHVVYKTSEKIFTDSDYSLIVHNEKSGYTATAHTAIVDSLQFMNPSTGFGSVSWYSTAGNYLNYDVRWMTGKDAKVFELLIKFYFGERTIGGLQADTGIVEWRFPRIKANNLNGNETMNISIPGLNFYNLLISRLDPPHQDTVRAADRLEFIITTGGDAFSTYLDVIGVNPGIAQVTPNYTNINNGLGVFSSRLSQSISKEMNSISIDQLACGTTTRHLRFLMNSQMICPP